MGVTVGEIIRTSGLDLRLVAGSEGLSHSVRWVHVSELEDPTPWLKGGELLLTTGMGVGKSPAAQRAYLDRLTGADLAGLGFGTGFSFRAVPRALVVAADRASFPIFEVPYPVPFIAITEAVFTRLVAEQYDLLSRSLEAEHTLTRAVLQGQGPPGIIRALTKAVRGWGVLLDIHGALIACSPGAAREYVSVLWSEIQSPRADHLRFSLSMVDMGHHISIQPVASQGRIEAFLAVGKRDPLTQFDRIVSSHALSLLAIELTKARAVSEAERRLKGDLLDQILRSALPSAEARQALERIGFDLSRPLGVAVFFGQQPAEELALVCEEVLARQASAFMASPRDDVGLTLLQPEGPG
jgi:purine catabolism regulator